MQRSNPVEQDVAIVDVWREPEAREFFRNVWPMYVHEISGFDTDFYALDDAGRWFPDIVEDWASNVTPARNLRIDRSADDPGQPFQRTHVITSHGRPVGFVCIGVQPLRYMPDDADVTIFEFFLVHASRGSGVGISALKLLLPRYAGRWYLRAIHDNARAIHFWRKALPLVGAQELDERHERGDVEWRFVVSG